MAATEPVETSVHYDPTLDYTPPVGRLPVLGKLRAEIDLVRAQAADVRNTIVNRDLAQIDSHDKITADIAAQATQVADNTRKIDGELAALAQQTINDTTKTTNDTNRAVAEVAYTEAKTLNENQQTVNDTTRTTDNHDKTVAEIAYMNAKTTNETNIADAEVTRMGVQNTNDTTQTADNTRKITADIAAQENKVDAEVDLLRQKAATELAQTSDTIPAGIAYNTSSTVTGVVGKQKALFEKQTQGFDRDAEQKLAKIFADSFNVRAATSDGALAGSAGLGEGDIAGVMNYAKSGHGVA